MISDHPWGTKQCHFVPSCLWSNNHWGTKQSQFVPLCLWNCLTTLEVLTVSLCPFVFVKLSDNHWCTKQSHFVPSCLWSCLTTIDVQNSLALSHRVCEVIWQPLRYQTVSFCPIVFVELSDNHRDTKQSHFVPSCFRSCLTTLGVLNSLTLSPSCLPTLEVPNSLTLSDSVCDDIWPPLR